MDASMRRELEALIAQSAESVEGAAHIIEDMMQDGGLDRGMQARMHVLRDALCACAGRIDAAADLVDTSER